MAAVQFVPGGETPATTAPTRPGDGGEQTTDLRTVAPAGHVGATR